MCTRGSDKRDVWVLAVTGALAFFASSHAAAEIQDPAAHNVADVRKSTTDYYDRDGRARISLQTRTEDSYGSLQTEGLRTRPGRTVESAKTSPSTAAAKGTEDFWIYYADVQLFNDDDGDGYFHGIDVLFDADTYFEVADVYAVLYLSYEGGPWNEYAVSETFSIYGATSDDEYVVVSELKSGYPTGSYDLLIELYDTWDGSFVADLGPEDNPDLGLLPLEDFNRDDPRRDSPRHGGGALDWLTAFLLGSAFMISHVLRRRGRVDGKGQPGFPTVAAAIPSRRAVRITLRPQADSESK